MNRVYLSSLLGDTIRLVTGGGKEEESRDKQAIVTSVHANGRMQTVDPVQLLHVY